MLIFLDGAALFYTTVKDKRTHDKLYKYLIHKLYSYSFNYPASVVDRESIFIPSGWDNEGKINILLENSTTIKSDSEYSDVISKPSIRKPLQRDVETAVAQDDQEFLAKLQIILNKASTPSVKPVNMFYLKIIFEFIFSL
jgi:dynein light intermediate chain 1